MSLYDDLGVTKDASEADLKKAYRKKARETHPDRGGKTEDFVRVKKAFEVLYDPHLRAHYDSTGNEEKPKGPNPYEVITQVFMQIASQADTQYQNILEAVIRHFKQKRAQASNQTSEFVPLSKKYRNLQRRLKVKGANPVGNAARQKRVEVAQQYIGMRMSRVLIDSCLKTLEEYEYEVDSLSQEEKYRQFNHAFMTGTTFYAR